MKCEPESPIEVAERQVFDIVAVTATSGMPEFNDNPAKTKRFNLRMLKSAIERTPEDLQLILTEVLELPKKQQKELAALLQETTLTSIINAAKIVSDRLNFIASLEAILTKPHITLN